jgi:hypothetical protein
VPALAPLLVLCLLAQTGTTPPADPTAPRETPPPPDASVVVAPPVEPPPAELVVAGVVEDLRKAELMLDADLMALAMAQSFSFIEGSSRLFGQFAYLEPVRRARERGDTVRQLAFDRIQVSVFGASAVATYRYEKRWKEQGAVRVEEGWCSDVFELRDDGAWILVHRHRTR